MQIVQIKLLRYTVAQRGHATYIFISRDKKTVYRANDKLRIIAR